MEAITRDLAQFYGFVDTYTSTLAPMVQEATVIALSGDLGAGKTTFVQQAAFALQATERVSSPTFVIMKFYPLPYGKFRKIIHIDAYRLKSAEELKKLGWEELLQDPFTLIFIEWPENVRAALPKSTRWIKFNLKSGEIREITYD